MDVQSAPKPTQPVSLWALAQDQLPRYLTAIAAMAVGNVFLLLIPVVIKFALDALFAKEAKLWTVLIPAAVGIVFLQAAHGFFTYLRGRWSAQASEGLVRKLRHRLFAHLERLPSSYFDTAETGDIVQRCSSDVETVRVFLAAQVVEIARVGLFILIAVPIMFWHNWWMSMLCLSLVPLIIFFAILYFGRVRKIFEQVDEAEGSLTTVLQENLTGIRVVRAFSRQDYEVAKFDQRNGKFRDLEFQLFNVLCHYYAISDVLCLAQLGIALVGGGYLVVDKQISLGTWILFWWLLRTIIWPIRHFGRVLSDSGRAVVAIRRIREILSEAEESDADDSTEAISGSIEINGVSFGFPGGTKVLDDISLTIHEGETVALMGPPGAGKSTLIALLLRLYDYETGSIQFGGQELNQINRDVVRRSFGVVLQDPFLFSKSVRDNIRLGNRHASDEDIETVSHAADLHSNVVDFRDGYDTKVGERGVTLSGGQRQRLAIARALLKDHDYLVLDDSLSAVDTQTEATILRSLAARRGQRTTILIAHRISSTRIADRIIVLHHGRIVQQGTHAELSTQDGPYQRLWKIQGQLEGQISADLEGISK